MKRGLPQLALALLPIAGANAQSSPMSVQDVEALNQRYQRVQLQVQQQRLDNELARLQREHAELTAGIQSSGIKPKTTPGQQITKGTSSRPHRLLSSVSFEHLQITLYDVHEQRHWHLEKNTAFEGGTAWRNPDRNS